MTDLRQIGAPSGARRATRAWPGPLRPAVAALLLLIALPAWSLGLEPLGEIVPFGGETGLLAPAGIWFDEVRDLLVLACPNVQRVVAVDRRGGGRKELGKEGTLTFPRAAVTTRDGTLYVASPERESIAVLERYATALSEEVHEISLSPHRGAAIVRPGELFADERGRLYVADRANHQILVLERDGKLERTLGGVGDPVDLWADGAGMVYVAEPGLGGVRVYDGRGKLVRTLGISPSQFPEPLRPRALTVDRTGRIWILEEGNRGIRALDASGNSLFAMKLDGLFAPADLAVDGRGTLYVVDEAGGRISAFRITGT